MFCESKKGGGWVSCPPVAFLLTTVTDRLLAFILGDPLIVGVLGIYVSNVLQLQNKTKMTTQ